MKKNTRIRDMKTGRFISSDNAFLSVMKNWGQYDIKTADLKMPTGDSPVDQLIRAFALNNPITNGTSNLFKIKQ